MSAPAAASSPSATLLRAAGLTLACYLGALPLLRLPCLGGGCDAVLGSSYARWAGVPVGWFGAALWLVALLAPSARVRSGAHHLLAAGSIGFVGLQAAVIGKFCPWCLAHAALCWISWPWRARESRRPLLGAGIAIVVAVLALTVQRLAWPSPSPAVVLPANLGAEACDWLEASAPGGPLLVLSPTCPTCLDGLERLAARGWPTGTPRPRLLWHTEAANRELAATLVAAVESHPAGASDAFAAMLPVFLAQRNLILADPAAAARLLAATWSVEPGAVQSASARLARQEAALADAQLFSTPLWIVPGHAASSDVPW